MPQGFVEPHVAINTLDGPRAGHLRAIRFPRATILLAALHRVFLHLCEAGSYVELGIIRPICPGLVRIVSQHNGLLNHPSPGQKDKPLLGFCQFDYDQRLFGFVRLSVT